MNRTFGLLTVSVFLVTGNWTSGQDTRPVPPEFPGPGVPRRLASPAANTFPATQARPPGVVNPLIGVPVQDVGPTRNQGPFGRSKVPSGDTMFFGQSQMTSPFGMSKAEREFSRKIRETIKAVKDAGDSQSEVKATKDLRESLAGLFDERMKRRQDEIDKLKERLKELETKNDARKSKKDEIVDLKLKSMVNEAKGFGF